MTSDAYEFGDSWRIRVRDTNAFTCKPADGDPFEDPNHKPRKDLDGIDPAIIQAARDKCRGLQFEEQCIFDVAIGLTARIDPAAFIKDEIYQKGLFLHFSSMLIE